MAGFLSRDRLLGADALELEWETTPALLDLEDRRAAALSNQSMRTALPTLDELSVPFMEETSGAEEFHAAGQQPAAGGAVVQTPQPADGAAGRAPQPSPPPARDDWRLPTLTDLAAPFREPGDELEPPKPPDELLGVGGRVSPTDQARAISVSPELAGPMPDTPVDHSSREGFVRSIMPYAQQVERETGIPASILVAIPLNEQGWQKEAPGHNYFGIKGSNPRTGANTGPVQTWEDYGGGRVNIRDTFRAYDNPAESFRDFAQFLNDNPRYAGALEVLNRTGDPAAFIREVHKAGYATDPAWSDKILNIAGGLPSQPASEIAPGSRSARPGGTSDAIAAQQARAAVPPGEGDYPSEDIEGINQVALNDPDKWALCGPVAAVMAATRRGGQWTVEQAKKIASGLDLWTADLGMRGLEAEAKLLRNLGLSAETGAAEQARLARDASSGNTPIISTNKHYYILDGYDPSTGKFDTVTTGPTMRGGHRWMTLDEIAAQGGGIQGAAYIDNPASPNPGTAAPPADPAEIVGSSPADIPTENVPDPFLEMARGLGETFTQGFERDDYRTRPGGVTEAGIVDPVAEAQAMGPAQSPGREIVPVADAPLGVAEGPPSPAPRNPIQQIGDRIGSAISDALAPLAPLLGGAAQAAGLREEPTPAPAADFDLPPTIVPPPVPESLTPQARAIDTATGPTITSQLPGAVGDVVRPVADMATAFVPPIGVDDAEAQRRADVLGQVGDVVGTVPRAITDATVGAADMLLGASHGRERDARMREIEATAAGYRLGTLDPRWEAEHPDLAAEFASLRTEMVTDIGPLGAAKRVPGAAARAVQGVVGSNQPTPIRPGVPRQERAAELARPIVLTDEAQIARINLKKFPPEIEEDLLNAARGTGFGERLRRGVLSDEVVRTLAEEYAPTVESAIATSRRGRAYSAEEIVALRNLMVGQGERVKTLATEVASRNLPVDEHTATMAQLALEQRKLALLGDVVFGGAPAEAGRALRQFRQLAQSLESDPAAAGLRYLRQQFGSLEAAEEVTAKYLTMVQSGAGPIELTKYLRTAKGDWLNRLGIIRYASMLSSTTTHAINSAGGALMQGMDLTALPIATVLDVGRVAGARALGKTAEREVFLSEFPARLHGMQSGAATGFQDAVFTMLHGIRPEDITKLDHLRQGFGTDIPVVAPRGSKAAGAVDFIVEGPLRALSAADVFFRTMSMGGHLAGEATAKAMKAAGGKKASLVAVSEAMDDRAVIERAEYLARRSVLQEENFGRELAGRMKGMSGPGRMAAEGLMPFIATPWTIISQGVGMTPAGVVKAVTDARAGKGARDVEETLARVAIGGMVMAASAHQYLAGNLTGPRPEEESERSTLPPGWREWSARIVLPNGEARYFPLAPLGPLAVPSVVAILVAEAAKQGKAPNLAETAVGIAKFASDQTFLRGIGDFSAALNQGGVKIENFIEGLATQYSPHFLGGGALGRQIQQVMDQPQRDPQGAIQAILATLPYGAGVSEAVGAGAIPLRRDVLGRPQRTAPGGVETALSPFRTTVERDAPVIRAYRRAGEGLPMAAPKKVTDPDEDRQVPLSIQQQGQWRVAFGAELQRLWQEEDQPVDVALLRRIEQQARDEATRAVLGR